MAAPANFYDSTEKRPCGELVEMAADIVANHLGVN